MNFDVSAFSQKLAVVNIESLIKIELSNKEQKQSFSAMREAQRFICDMLPHSARFVFELSNVRSSIQEFLRSHHSPEESRTFLAACDRRINVAHLESLEFVVKWLGDYFQKSHDYSKPRESVTASIRYLSQNPAKAIRIASSDCSREPVEVLASHDTVTTLFTIDSRDHQFNVGAFTCNDVVDRVVRSQFVHPSLNDSDHPSFQIMRQAYFNYRSRFRRVLSGSRLGADLMEKWHACWKKAEHMHASVCVFPITLANNNVPQIVKDGFSRQNEDFNQKAVLGLLSFSSQQPNMFNVGDVLLGKIVADSLYLFAGIDTHYKYYSALRASLLKRCT